MKVIVIEKVLELIKTKFRSDYKTIWKAINKLEENPKMGDYVFGIENLDCREIKIKGLRIFTIQYHNKLYVASEDEFKNAIKVVDIIKKNKTKQQQQTIDDIKQRLKSFGIKLE